MTENKPKGRQLVNTNEHQKMQVVDTPKQHKKLLFEKDIQSIMIGCGDSLTPYHESVELLEEMLLEFLFDLTEKAAESGKRNKITVDDVLYVVRNDVHKNSRIKDLLRMHETIKNARTAFDDDQNIKDEAGRTLAE